MSFWDGLSNLVSVFPKSKVIVGPIDINITQKYNDLYFNRINIYDRDSDTKVKV